MRKLASVQTIDKLTPIPDADLIEVARVLGWNVVCKKGEFQVGDLCVYCEIDSVFPDDNPEFAFLEKSRYRIKTKKMRGVVSQGICFPMSILPENQYEIDQDVTDILGIEKYEPKSTAQLSGEIQGLFPSFISKTDETRVQTFGRALALNVGLKCNFTEKLDGTSATYFLKDGEFGVCSRNMQLKWGDNVYHEMAQKYGIEKILHDIKEMFGDDTAIQGEVVGAGIQGNKYKFEQNERKLFVFNVVNLDTQEYFNNQKVADFCAIHGLLSVPILGEVEIVNDIDFFVNLSIGKSVIYPKTEREGIVIRAINDMNDPLIGRFSFKAINPKFLLKYEDD